ncbi:MAG TPA: EAL domain-containing protein [Usitatibacter sp.]|nr:EAL domain-containing protein [Usitatibacter sp.]
MENWSRVAEDLLRAGAATSLQWDGLTITTHFQPILRIRPVECAGFEALLRAVDADGAPADPQAIFRDAQAAGRLIELDRTCRALHLRNFATVDPGEGKLFLNVHPEAAVQDLANMREFGALIRYYGLVAKRVCVEILPNACLREERLADAARAYRELGVTVAVDHFASGSSNFDRVAAIRPPLVKLRRSVIADTVGRAKAGRRVDAVIELLREAGAQVVLEDVETAQDAMLAIASGAAYAQGNYLASPSSRIGGEALGAGMLRELLRIGAEEAAAVEG